MKLYEVAVAAPLHGTLTYSYHSGLSVEPVPGIRVLVPLGNRLVTGYVLGNALTQEIGETTYTIKSIADLLDPAPLFPPELIPFFRWIAEYYHFPLGNVIKTALPGGLVACSGREVILTEAGRQELPQAILLLKQRKAWMDRLLEKEKLLPGTVLTIRRKPAMYRLLEKWQESGWIDIKEILVKPAVSVKRVTMVGLTGTMTEKSYKKNTGDLEELTTSEEKTLDLFFTLRGEQQVLPRPELTRRYTGAGKALHSLVRKGLVTLEEQRCYRDPFGEIPPFFPKPDVLTEEQDTVLEQLLPAIETQGFTPFLLFGVTGCGKTEVYLRATAQCLQQGKTALVLVPEIALASQLEAHFYSRFGENLAVFHSGLSPGERFDQWFRILSGKASVVIGARSAVFCPVSDLGLIIVDEEHESAYKQDEGLHYNGRDLAVLRAKFAECPVVLGSATPSVISFYHARQKKYQLLTMRSRVNAQPMPRVELIDLGKEKRSRPDLFFSDQLIRALNDNMERRMQSLLFVNRRGFSSSMLCQDCGYILQCRHCQVSLTHHRKNNRLVCHYCGYTVSPTITCPECRGGKLKGLGVGSERIEDEVRQLIPHARVARLDSDTTRDRKKYMAVLQQIRNHDIDILVGTQMVAKGLHFPKMTLVGVVWADSGLGMPDYKAPERTFQMLTQVTGRAGREEHQGQVIIQTHQPAHYAIKCACEHDYEQLYEQEIALRSGLGYPPFSRLVKIGFSGECEELVAKAARKTGSFLRQRSAAQTMDILGPVPAPLGRIKKRYRWHVLLKSHHLGELHRICDSVHKEKTLLCASGVRLTLDVDPENML